MPWPFENSPPHRAPEQALAYFCARRGITPEEAALPPVLVAAFQGAAYQRLLEGSGAVAPSERADGTALSREVAIGQVGGRPVAVARFGVGAPATALGLELAIARGVRDILVAGAAGSLRPELPLGSVAVVTEAEREDGTSHHYLPAGQGVSADPELAEALMLAARDLGLRPARGRTWTIDAPYRETLGGIRRHQQAGVSVVEMEAAAIFAVAQVRGARAGLIVAISDELFGPYCPGFHLPPYLEALQSAAEAVLRAAASLGVRAEQSASQREPCG